MAEILAFIASVAVIAAMVLIGMFVFWAALVIGAKEERDREDRRR